MDVGINSDFHSKASIHDLENLSSLFMILETDK